MNRRTLLAGLGSLGALGAGGMLVFGGQGASSERQLEPVTIDPLDVPASPDEPFQVPFEGSVTVIDLFATWCKPCIEHMGTLRAVRSASDESVRFVSVTNEAVGGDLTRDDIQDWWGEHGGEWRVGFDDDGTLTRTTGSKGLPHTVIVDENSVIRWGKTGTVPPAEIRTRIEALLG